MSPPSGTAPAAGLNTGAGADAGHPILALGAWFKHAACLLEADGWTFGPNLGDLDNADACADVEPAVEALLARAAGPVRAVAHDLHPDFHSTRVALATAARLGVPAIGVQHHHAHVGAVLAEHVRFDTRPVLGLALDGVGLGSDGEAWGASCWSWPAGSSSALVACARCACPVATAPRANPGAWRQRYCTPADAAPRSPPASPSTRPRRCSRRSSNARR